METQILYKLTMKVPGTKIMTDFLFGAREELDHFLEVNRIKPFSVNIVIKKERSH